MQIDYLFDPLCGWCYGAAPAIRQIAAKHEVRLCPTGLFAHGNRHMDTEFSTYAWENDQRIAKLTGAIFSPAYQQNLLYSNLPFDSQPMLLALTAVGQTAPDQELAALSALQQVRYQNGQNTADPAVVRTVLNALGLSAAARLLDESDTAALTAERCAAAQKLMQQYGLQGVPQLLVHTAHGVRALPSRVSSTAMQTMLLCIWALGRQNQAKHEAALFG
ncbi:MULTISPECIES: DsbA family protein [Eikenella]|uniref:DSBA-like thioredoxin domain-containing protein n=1 Tax=Eikenella longinqua TaxID=1795827 RepID=A0A1A9S1X1_9NEIS|nr:MULTISPECIES: DsbA family protein [Eikenella]OAM31523.1 hypothetical protein A7P95_00400 [Eikenella longinqua]